MSIATVNGININYQVTGQGEPLLMLAGLAMAHDGWHYLVAYFKTNIKQLLLTTGAPVNRRNPPAPTPPKCWPKIQFN
jgi:pimeloyl-ACP methyl ester carboxylesterase